jgi:hypothetical protein
MFEVLARHERDGIEQHRQGLALLLDGDGDRRAGRRSRAARPVQETQRDERGRATA